MSHTDGVFEIMKTVISIAARDGFEEVPQRFEVDIDIRRA
jgi:hypothetical protein